MPLRRLLVILLTGFLSLLAHQGADAQTIGIGCSEPVVEQSSLFSFRPGQERCLINPTTPADNAVDVDLLNLGLDANYNEKYSVIMRVTSGGALLSSSGSCSGSGCAYESQSAAEHSFTCIGTCGISLAATDESGRDITLDGDLSTGDIINTSFFQAGVIYKVADTTPPEITLEYQGFDAGTDIATFGYTVNETVTQGSVNPGVSSGDASFDGIDTNTGTISYKVGSPGTFVAALGEGVFVDAAGNPSGAVSLSSGDIKMVVDATGITVPETIVPDTPFTMEVQLSRATSAGYVEIYRDQQPLGSANVVDGVASMVVKQGVGSAFYEAGFFDGTGGYYTTTGMTSKTVVVEALPMSLNIDPLPNVATVYDDLTVSGTLSDAGFSGQVVVDWQTGQTQAVVEEGHFSASVPLEQVGPFSFVVRTSGDTRYNDWQSGQMGVEVQPLDVSQSFDFQFSPAPYYVGDSSAVLNVMVSDPRATGDLVMSVDGVDVASKPAGEVVTFALPVESEGEKALSVRYEGDDDTAYFLRNFGTITVLKADPGLMLSLAETSDYAPGDMVTAVASMPGAVASGTVRFFLDGAQVGEDVTVDGSGVYESTFEAGPVGYHQVTARYLGNTRYQSAESSKIYGVEQLANPLTLTVDKSEIAPTDIVALTAALAEPSDGGDLLVYLDGMPLAKGSAVLGVLKTSLSFPEPGTYELTAEFTGSTRYQKSLSEPVTISVAYLPADLALSASATTGAPGDEVVLTASLSPAAADGVISLYQGDSVTPLDTKVATGAASYDFTVKLAGAGTATYVARYAGADRHAEAASEPVSVSVEKLSVALHLKTETPHPTVGDRVTIDVIFEPDPGEGTVAIDLDGQMAMSLMLNGSGTYPVDLPFYEPGLHLVEARYSGTERFEANTASLKLDVGLIPTALTLKASDTAPFSGDTVTLTARMNPADAVGTVLFTADGGTIGEAPVMEGLAVIDWTVEGAGDIEVLASFTGKGLHAEAVSAPLAISIGANSEELFEEREEEVGRIVEAESDRANRARLRHTDWMMREARSRLRQSNAGDAFASQNWTPLTYDGVITGEDSGGYWTGTFFGGGDRGGFRRFVYGDFDVVHEEDYGTTVEFNGAVAAEKQLSDRALAGVYLGAELGRSNIANAFDGRIDTAGVNLGAYAARRIGDDVIVDGFLNVARLFHQMDLSDDSLSISGDYASTAVQFGGAITGERVYDDFTLMPEFALAHSVSWSDDAVMEAESAAGIADVALDGDRTSTSRLSLTPRFVKPIDFGFDSAVTLSPRLACEMRSGDTGADGCGVGLGLGLDLGFADGRGRFTGDVEVEQIGGKLREMLSLEVTYDF